MSNLSVAIATYNEEKNIENCLKSIFTWVNEIVVVDGSSQDKTVAIVKKYTSRIIITDNPNIFHLNKQKAIDVCRGKWILQLDADEVVTPELKEEILDVINLQLTTHNLQQINGYWIPRRNYFLGKFLTKGGQYPDYTLRLYRRGKSHLPCKSVHEQAIVVGKIGYLKNPLLHYPYSNFSHYLEHFNRYTDIFSKEYKDINLKKNYFTFVDYMIVKPIFWFFKTYLRHKGFVDGYPGLIFSFFSSLRYPVSYIKYLRKF